MNAPIFEPRPLYGIGTVARLTGLKPDTLRVWERRYGLGASHKSATGRRQYTQADLEHLQLVAALVKGGARIGEIASSERKTLEMLLKQQRGHRGDSPVRTKPRAVLIGAALCEWLDDHQGCLSNVSANLARVELSELDDEALLAAAEADVLVVECPNLTSGPVTRLLELRDTAPDVRLIVCYRFGSEHWLKEFESHQVVAMSFPPEPGRLAFEIAHSAVKAEVEEGESNLGELVSAKARQFGSSELSAARRLKSALDCECPRHIADLIEALANFEDYSASCSVDNWHDAAVHACIYAYTGQARHLMEKAMQAVLEDRGDEFRELVREVRREKHQAHRAA
jgi:DNA-binding transcriptional MerR regulator